MPEFIYCFLLLRLYLRYASMKVQAKAPAVDNKARVNTSFATYLNENSPSPLLKNATISTTTNVH